MLGQISRLLNFVNFKPQSSHAITDIDMRYIVLVQFNLLVI
jgi:hypothetical protein